MLSNFRRMMALSAALAVISTAPPSSRAAENDARKTTDGHIVTTVMLDPVTSAKSAAAYAFKLGTQTGHPWIGHARQQAVLLLRPVFGLGGASLHVIAHLGSPRFGSGWAVKPELTVDVTTSDSIQALCAPWYRPRQAEPRGEG